MLIASALISGLGLGSMYGLLALGFFVTYAVSNTVNFAQGSTMMLGAVVCFTIWVTLSFPLTFAIIVGLAACAAWGIVVERIAVRPFVERNSESWLMRPSRSASSLITLSCSHLARIRAACRLGS
jgi:branched-chain amino acid transport system permease protein